MTYMTFYRLVKEALGVTELNDRQAKILMVDFYLNANYDVEKACKAITKV